MEKTTYPVFFIRKVNDSAVKDAEFPAAKIDDIVKSSNESVASQSGRVPVMFLTHQSNSGNSINHTLNKEDHESYNY